MDKVFDWIARHTDELTETYKQLHMYPELGMQELKTSAYLAEELRKAGYEVHEKIGGTGVVGVLHGKTPGLSFALRADMDALPMEENTNLPYASKIPGVMHACGHDSHCAMLLYAAKAIAATGGIQRGTLTILFQPAEETLQGARAIINSGILRDVEEIVGIHVRNNSEAPVGHASYAIYHGASWVVKAKVQGLAAHGAWLHRGINSVDAAAAIVNAINAIRIDPRVTHSVKTTRIFAGGKATNIIPDTAEMAFDLRAQNNETMKDLLEKTERAIATGAATVGATAEVEIVGGVPAAAYDDALVADVKASIEAICGKAMPAVYTPGGEDFHCYSVDAGIKTGFIGLGADMNTGGHTTTMRLDLAALPIGVKIIVDLVNKKLR